MPLASVRWHEARSGGGQERLRLTAPDECTVVAHVNGGLAGLSMARANVLLIPGARGVKTYTAVEPVWKASAFSLPIRDRARVYHSPDRREPQAATFLPAGSRKLQWFDLMAFFAQTLSLRPNQLRVVSRFAQEAIFDMPNQTLSCGAVSPRARGRIEGTTTRCTR